MFDPPPKLNVPIGQKVDVVEVGAAGLVITDVWNGDSSSIQVRLYEGESLRYRQDFFGTLPPQYHAMTTGVVFAPGTTLRVDSFSSSQSFKP